MEEASQDAPPEEGRGKQGLSPGRGRNSFFRAAVLAFALSLSEWLFFVTKPSFLDAAPPLSRFATLWAVSALAVSAALAVHGAFFLLGRGWALCGLPGKRFIERCGSSLVPAFLLTAISLLLVDNFTYTVFSWGIVSTVGPLTALYLVALVGVFVFFLRREMRLSPWLPPRWRGRLVRGWLLAGLLSTGWLVVTEYEALGEEPTIFTKKKHRPNIIVFSADGVEAEMTSAYGYELQTTPHLDRYLDRALLFRNAFTNSGKTTGSLTAMMTGRHATTTRVLFPPHTLRGSDAYRNLPRILRRLGYRSIQATIRYYADGPDLNWKDSFEYANHRQVRNHLAEWAAVDLALDLPLSLGRQIGERLSDRLQHVLSLRRMVNFHQEVAFPDMPPIEFSGDELRIGSVLRFIDEDDAPFFAHIHLLETHCCPFVPERPHYSIELEKWTCEESEAAYVDTIMGTDARFGELMAFLEERELLDDTLVVYTSDHTRGWDFDRRLPLIFFFPRQEAVGEVDVPAQLIDVAPTILDYLGLEIPDWMEGDSLLRELPRNRPLFSASSVEHRTVFAKDFEIFFEASNAGPPHYGMRRFGMIACQRWHTLDMKTGDFQTGDMPGFVAPCPEDMLPSPQTARAWMEEHLLQRGFGLPEEIAHR